MIWKVFGHLGDFAEMAERMGLAMEMRLIQNPIASPKLIIDQYDAPDQHIGL